MRGRHANERSGQHLRAATTAAHEISQGLQGGSHPYPYPYCYSYSYEYLHIRKVVRARARATRTPTVQRATPLHWGLTSKQCPCAAARARINVRVRALQRVEAVDARDGRDGGRGGASRSIRARAGAGGGRSAASCGASRQVRGMLVAACSTRTRSARAPLAGGRVLSLMLPAAARAALREADAGARERVRADAGGRVLSREALRLRELCR